MVFLLICWLPYFLVYYPGFILADSCSSINQAYGYATLSNHFPVLYTLFIKLCITIGSLIKSDTAGCALYTVLQMMYVAFAISKSIVFLHKNGISKKICYIIAIFFSITPFFAQISIAMWKDLIFAASILLWTLLIIDNIVIKSECTDRWFPLKNIVLMFFICFSRNNGIYVVILCLIISLILLIFYKKSILSDLKKFVFTNLIMITAYYCIVGPIYNAFGIDTTSETIESSGVFFSQMARVAAYNGDMSENDYEFMNAVFPIERYSEGYKPTCIDELKWNDSFNTDYLNNHKLEYMTSYISMGLKNPRLYLEGWELITYGYWAPNRWELCNDSGNIVNGNLQSFTTGDYNKNICGKIYPHNLLSVIDIDWTSIIKSTGSIVSLSLIHWIMMFASTIVIIKKKWRYLLCLAPSFGVFLTLLIASPYVYWQRYGLAEYYLLPVYLYIIWACIQPESIIKHTENDPAIKE